MTWLLMIVFLGSLSVVGISDLDTEGWNAMQVASQRRSSNPPPTAIVQEILEGIRAQLQKESAAHFDDEPMPIRPYVEITVAKLGLRLPDDVMKAIEGDWKSNWRSARQHFQEGPIDRRAKRILVWQLQWLYRHGLYPQRQVRLLQLGFATAKTTLTYHLTDGPAFPS